MKIFKTGNKKGITIVYIAILIVALFAVLGLVIDIGYMYVVKGQLQNAADASALAGAAKIRLPVTGPAAFQQYSARSAAQTFASKNYATREPVVVASDPNSNTLSLITAPGENDITFGHWSSNSYHEGLTPVNAIRVRTRRTVPGENAANQGQVSTFLGRIFSLLPGGGVGFPFMSPAAEAIAIQTPLPVLPMVICLPRCDEVTSFTATCPGKKFIMNDPDSETECGIAWANIENPCPSPDAPTCQPPNVPMIRNYLKNPRYIDLCNKCLRTKQGIGGGAYEDLKEAFDRNKETINSSEFGLTGVGVSSFEGWRVLMPIIEVNPVCGTERPPAGPKPCPGDQPNPYLVTRVAEVILTRVDTPPHDDCPTCKKDDNRFIGITLLGTRQMNSTSTTIKCLTCDPPDPRLPPTRKVKLVR